MVRPVPPLAMVCEAGSETVETASTLLTVSVKPLVAVALACHGVQCDLVRPLLDALGTPLASVEMAARLLELDKGEDDGRELAAEQLAIEVVEGRLQRLAQQAGHARLDEEPQIAMQYGITGIPALQVFQGGQLVKQMVGARPKPVLVSELSEFIG